MLSRTFIFQGKTRPIRPSLCPLLQLATCGPLTHSPHPTSCVCDCLFWGWVLLYKKSCTFFRASSPVFADHSVPPPAVKYPQPLPPLPNSVIDSNGLRDLNCPPVNTQVWQGIILNPAFMDFLFSLKSQVVVFKRLGQVCKLNTMRVAS